MKNEKKIMKNEKKTRENEKKQKKLKKNREKGKNHEKMKISCKKRFGKCLKTIWEMSFQQFIFGKCLSGFVRFSKKCKRGMSIWRHEFEVLTMNPLAQLD